MWTAAGSWCTQAYFLCRLSYKTSVIYKIRGSTLEKEWRGIPCKWCEDHLRLQFFVGLCILQVVLGSLQVLTIYWLLVLCAENHHPVGHRHPQCGVCGIRTPWPLWEGLWEIQRIPGVKERLCVPEKLEMGLSEELILEAFKTSNRRCLELRVCLYGGYHSPLQTPHCNNLRHEIVMDHAISLVYCILPAEELPPIFLSLVRCTQWERQSSGGGLASLPVVKISLVWRERSRGLIIHILLEISGWLYLSCFPPNFIIILLVHSQCLFFHLGEPFKRQFW